MKERRNKAKTKKVQWSGNKPVGSNKWKKLNSNFDKFVFVEGKYGQLIEFQLSVLLKSLFFEIVEAFTSCWCAKVESQSFSSVDTYLQPVRHILLESSCTKTSIYWGVWFESWARTSFCLPFGIGKTDGWCSAFSLHRSDSNKRKESSRYSMVTYGRVQHCLLKDAKGNDGRLAPSWYFSFCFWLLFDHVSCRFIVCLLVVEHAMSRVDLLNVCWA